MLARWLAKLQQFHFEIIHRPGTQHGNADGLSRCPQCDRGSCAPNIQSEPSDPEQPYASSCIGSSLDSKLIPLESGETCMAAVMLAQSDNSKLIIAEQMTDLDITIVRKWFSDGKFPARAHDFAPASHDLKSYWIGRRSLFLDDAHILWRHRSESSSRAQLVVRRSLRDTMFNDCHHTTYGGHFGITHTYTKLQLHYFWPGMSDFVRDRISACHKSIESCAQTRHQATLALTLHGVQQALHESYDEVRAQQQRATHRQKRNYDSKAVARAFPIGCWTLQYYPPARRNKLCSPWIGPYKVVRAPMEWVVGIQLDADARIIYVHMDDLKRCAPPDPEPTWPDAARGTSVVVSTRAPSTLALSDATRDRNSSVTLESSP